MKYQIVCDQPGRLRTRFGKYVFTKEQCYGITNMLLSIDGVVNVVAKVQNGSIFIEYNQSKTRDCVLQYLSELSLNEVVDGVPNDDDKARMLVQDFQKVLGKHVASHFIGHWVLPTSISRVFTYYRALPYIKEAIVAIKNRKMSVSILDASAITASLAAGSYKTASSTMFLLKLSEILLDYSNARAKNALIKSLSINIDTVWCVKDDTEVEVALPEVQVGDVIRVRTGSMIPLDGIIISGDASINQSTMTGEPIPVHRTVDDNAFAGTVLEDGEIDIRVSGQKHESRIAKIVDMIDSAEQDKSTLQGRADRLADDIVPVSFGLFFATLLLTRNFARALSVLMVDFSCAIKLTTPIAIISALREGVNQQVLVKGGKYLEILSKVDTVVFDKTGTLTKAVPNVSKIISIKEGYEEEYILRVAACLEEHFPHSVATAIVEHARVRGVIHPEDHGKIEYIVAHGIATNFAGKHSIIGSRHFIFEDEKIPYPTEKKEWLEAEIGSDSAIYLAMDGELVGILCINDPPRPEAKRAIEMLYAQGITDIMMITGDSEANAKTICNELGLNRYYAGVLPDGKANIVEELKAEGRTVLMVGDGINDTPALSTANVSLTMNGCSDIAREVADISILSDDLTKVCVARHLAEYTMNKIQRQYGFIVAFNSILIGLGIGGMLAAETAALLHNSATIATSLVATQPVLRQEKIDELEEAKNID